MTVFHREQTATQNDFLTVVTFHKIYFAPAVFSHSFWWPWNPPRCFRKKLLRLLSQQLYISGLSVYWKKIFIQNSNGFYCQSLGDIRRWKLLMQKQKTVSYKQFIYHCRTDDGWYFIWKMFWLKKWTSDTSYGSIMKAICILKLSTMEKKLYFISLPCGPQF